ncbi:uncharacterized protein LOC132611764 [Lycium barbarum]|uniref:uncharacterized protein LOC132611764 n=1 Tax=Lycium barbarum TaxID=112863 RepID=UPI00293EA6BE|nr:uncharacterized protein LOC132611764 [Lycium barbarum]
MAEKIKKKTGLEWSTFTDYPAVPNGRLWICWKHQKVEVTVLYSDSKIVHCLVKEIGSQFSCPMTFVYGFNTVAARREIWRQLRVISLSMAEPWVILGDFNIVLSVNDRVNGAPIQAPKLVDFQECVEDLNLGLLTWRGSQYSWCNKRDADDRVYSLIDRALGNDLWFMQYSNLTAHYPPTPPSPECSDHSPIIINTGVVQHKLPRPFRLYNVLMQQQTFQTMVTNVWRTPVNGYAMYATWRKLKLIEMEAAHMNRELTTLETRIDELQEQVKTIQNQLQTDLFNPTLIQEERQRLRQLEHWSNVQERVLRQQSRATWISHGDSNSKFFHAFLKARQARNRISNKCNDMGVVLTEDQAHQEFLGFFKNLLGTSAAELPSLDITIARDGPCLTTVHQRQLVEAVTKEEVVSALKSLPQTRVQVLMALLQSSLNSFGRLLERTWCKQYCSFLRMASCSKRQIAQQ